VQYAVKRCSIVKDALTHSMAFSLSYSQPWEPYGTRNPTRVTPVAVEEIMESKPYGIEVSLIVVVVPSWRDGVFVESFQIVFSHVYNICFQIPVDNVFTY
jgi:hypothetical protein